MFTINKIELSKDIKTIAKIKGGKYNNMYVKCIPDGAKPKVTEQSHEDFQDLKLSDGAFVPTVIDRPQFKQRDTLCMLGPSGAGKSYYTKMYLLEYNKFYPDAPIYYFCPFRAEEDESLQGVKNIHSVDVSEKYLEEPLDLEDFENDCLIVFDDIDAVKSKKVRDEIETLINVLLNAGRHKNLSCIICSHAEGTGSVFLRTLMRECSQIVLYLGSGSYNTILRRYLSLSEKQIRTLKNFKSRHITFYRRYPNLYFAEKHIGYLADL